MSTDSAVGHFQLHIFMTILDMQMLLYCRIGHWITTNLVNTKEKEWNKKFWEVVITLSASYFTDWIEKWFSWQFCDCCLCILSCGNITKPLPSINGGYTCGHKLAGGILEKCHWDALRCHDMHAMFLEGWFWHLNFDKGLWIFFLFHHLCPTQKI